MSDMVARLAALTGTLFVASTLPWDARLPASCTQVQTALTASGLGTRISEPVTLPSGKINYNITGGTRPNNGLNLFHSFGEFSLATNHIANFLNETALPTSNIISRVTGGNPSNIWGTIQTTDFGTANLYLINPDGVLFGPTATLNVSGSFNASTADYLRFTDGAKFHAAPVQSTVLSIAPVEAFGFTALRPLAISIDKSHLQVPSGQTLSIVGGDIEVQTGNVSAPLIALGGRVNLASVASPTEVHPTQPNLDVNSSTSLGSITLRGVRSASNVNAFTTAAIRVDGQNLATDPGGSVVIRGGKVTFDATFADARGNPGGSVVIRRNQLLMNDSIITATSRGALDHPGTAVDIQVTGDIHLHTAFGLGTEISASAFAAGNAGNIRLVADTLRLTGNPSLGWNANIGSRSFGTASDAGNSGRIDISTRHLIVEEFAFIQTRTFGPGDAGSITIRTDSLEVTGKTEGAFSFIDSNTNGSGNAGTVDITADSTAVTGVAFTSTGVSRQSPTQFGTFQGNPSAGTLRITTESLNLLNGGQLVSNIHRGAGHGGTVEVTAANIFIPGMDELGVPAGIFTSTQSNATGDGGNIQVTASGDLTVADSGQINTSALQGQGGDFTLAANRVELRNGAFSTANSSGPGNAGNITIDAGSNFLATNSSIRTEAAQASGGNITLLATDMIRLRNSGISTSVFGPEGTTGGDIFIDPQFVILQSSQILAQATEGRGGNINILAGLFLADPNSVVSASSQLGVSGSVNIQSPIQNLSGALVPLRQDFLQGSELLAQRCAARMADAQTSTFVVVEHEGLPREPGSVLPSSVGLEEAAPAQPVAGEGLSSWTDAGQPLQLVAATGVCGR